MRTKGFIAGVLALAATAAIIRAQAGSTEVVLRAASSSHAGAWVVQSDSSASGGAALWLPDAEVPKLGLASASPANYFDLTFQVRAGVPYRLWLRGKAQNDSWQNDSAFVQFSSAVDASGTPVFRIGTTSATIVSLEDCGGCGVSGWGWSDNGYGYDGQLIYFAADGAQTVRVQGREDGFIIDEIVLSPQKYPDHRTRPEQAGHHHPARSRPASSGGGSTVTLVRGPYLQQPSDRSIDDRLGDAPVRPGGGALSKWHALGASRLASGSELDDADWLRLLPARSDAHESHGVDEL